MLVREWMTRNPVTVGPETSVLNARRLLQSYRIRHLPVVDEDHRIVGMLSDRDVLLRDGQVTQALTVLQSDLVWGRYRAVGTVMTPAPVQVARPGEPVGLAAQLMLQWQISALPVVEHGRLVGIITTTDCLRALIDQNPVDAPREGVRGEGVHAEEWSQAPIVS